MKFLDFFWCFDVLLFEQNWFEPFELVVFYAFFNFFSVIFVHFLTLPQIFGCFQIFREFSRFSRLFLNFFHFNFLSFWKKQEAEFVQKKVWKIAFSGFSNQFWTEFPQKRWQIIGKLGCEIFKTSTDSSFVNPIKGIKFFLIP